MTTQELAEYGLERMDEKAISGFVRSQKTGILGLPGDVPYLIPLSYGYDGQSLFFTFLEGAESKKGELARRADQATFLVYAVDSAFSWESVILTGALTELPADEWDDALAVLDSAWRPEVLENAQLAADIRLYELVIEERSGVRHNGLPPGMRE